MKKLILALATLGISLIPAVSASAMSYPSTTIANAQNQAAYINARKDNSSSSSNVSYYNANVNYSAIYEVNYSASVTSYNASMQHNNNSASLMAGYMNNSKDFFTTPAFLGSSYAN